MVVPLTFAPPITMFVAAPKAFTSVATVLNRFSVVAVAVTCVNVVPEAGVHVVVFPPKLSAVAAPNAFTVVAVAFSSAIVALPAMMEVVNVGEVALSNIATPVPFSSDSKVRSCALVLLVIPVIGSPVQLVSVPLLGVPSAPPLTTNAPALPTAMARAVPTFAPGVIPAHVVKSAS